MFLFRRTVLFDLYFYAWVMLFFAASFNFVQHVIWIIYLGTVVCIQYFPQHSCFVKFQLFICSCINYINLVYKLILCFNILCGLMSLIRWLKPFTHQYRILRHKFLGSSEPSSLSSDKDYINSANINSIRN